MCSPIAAAITLKAVTSAYGAYQQLQAGKYARGVAEYNARVAENEAVRVRNIGSERENLLRSQTAKLISSQKTQLAASGVKIDVGTPVKLQADAATMGEADALRIRSNFEARAESIETGADLTRMQGEQAYQAGKKRAVGTLLGGAASIGTSVLGSGLADKWFDPSSTAVVGDAFQPSQAFYAR